MFLQKKSDFIQATFRFEKLSLFFIFYSINSIEQANDKVKPCVSIFQGFQSSFEGSPFTFILPGCSFMEKHSFCMNFQGTIKLSPRVFFRRFLAKFDYKVFSHLGLLWRFSSHLANPKIFHLPLIFFSEKEKKKKERLCFLQEVNFSWQ